MVHRRPVKRRIFAPAAAKPQERVIQEPGADGLLVGERLKQLREARGFSQRELSAPGISYAYISRIEAGTRQPSVKALRKLADALDVTASYLECGMEMNPISKSFLRKLRRVESERDYLARELVRKQIIIDALTDKAADEADKLTAALG